MPLTEISTSLQVMSGATASSTLAQIKGKIYAVIVRTSASNTFHVYSLKQDGSTADVDILGSSMTPLTIASDTVYYPRIQAVGAAGTGIAGVYDMHYVDAEIKVDVASGTAADTYNIIVVYEPA